MSFEKYSSWPIGSYIHDIMYFEAGWGGVTSIGSCTMSAWKKMWKKAMFSGVGADRAECEKGVKIMKI